MIGALALVPFIALLILHGVDHDVPLFLASFAGFAVALARHRQHSEDAGAGAARGPPRIRGVLLPVSAVSVDHAADAGRVLRPDGGADSQRRRIAWPRPGRVGPVLRRHVPLGDSRQQHRRRLRVPRARQTSICRCSICSRWRRSRVTRWAAAGRTSDRRSRSSRTRSFSATSTPRFTPVQWIRQMTPIILEMFALITVVIAIESWLFSDRQDRSPA